MTLGTRLDPDRDLDIALSTASEMNRVIAAADAKAGLVLAAQGVVLAGMASGLRADVPLPGLARATTLLAVVLACSAVLLLVAALWPRTRGAGAAWFAFPSLNLGEVPPSRPDAAELAGQAWAQAGALAAIARRKYRWFRAALAGGTASLLAFTAWIAIVASI